MIYPQQPSNSVSFFSLFKTKANSSSQTPVSFGKQSIHFTLYDIFITHHHHTNMVTTRSQTKGPMTRARAAATAVVKKSPATISTTKKARAGRKPTKKKTRRARVACVAVAVPTAQQDAAPALAPTPAPAPAPAPSPAAVPVSVANYVFTRMQLLANSETEQHWTALRELLRRMDNFDEFHNMLRNFDAVIEFAAESGQEIEDRDTAFLSTVAEYFGSEESSGAFRVRIV